MILSWGSCTFLFLTSFSFIISIRSDPVEGSRILEEAFRDYDKRFRHNFGGLPVPVNVSIHLLSVSNINPAAMTYTLTFFIRQIWTDSRLSFSSRRNIETITMDAATCERIWKPDTYFVNEISAVNHDMLVRNQFCRISQEGVVLFSRRVTLTAFSPMSSNLFPYDSHKLKLELESYGSQTKDLKYYWTMEEAITSSIQYVPGFKINGFSAKDSSKTTSTGSYSRLSLQLVVKRNPLPYELGFMLSAFILSLLCLFATSRKMNPRNGVIIAVYLTTLIAIIYGFVIIKTLGGVSSMNLLQLHVLLCGVFGSICVIVNLKRYDQELERPSQKLYCETPVATENCNRSEAELPLSNVSSNLENRECPTDVDDNNEEEKRGKMINVRKYKSITNCFQPRLPLCGLFVSINLVFVLLCRLLQ